MTEASDFSDDGVAGCMLLAWSGKTASFALDAATVERVVEEREWRGEELLDLTEALDLDDGLEPVRVLELSAGSNRLALRAYGAMRLCVVAWSDLLDVPPLLRARDAGRFVRALAVIDGAPTLWILDAFAIHRDAIARRASNSEGPLEGAE